MPSASARRAPSEDVGAFRFIDVVEAPLDPNHEQYGRMFVWRGKFSDPDEKGIRSVLSTIADRRQRSLMSHRSGRRSP